MTKILILGGIKEASILAAKLVEEGHDVTTSLAGRTREPKPVAGKVRIGGFGGAQGLANFLQEHGFEQLIDATHPFAEQISANAKDAAKRAGIPIELHARAPWKQQEGDNWIVTSTLDEARRTIPQNARVLLALGSQHIAGFTEREDVFFLIRRVDPPTTPLPFKQFELLIGTPPINSDNEEAVLEAHGITHIICRNSGGKGAYAKIEAARNLGLPVIMIARPKDE